jgi:flavodoxin
MSMKCLIIVKSYHHGNTRKIAGVMAEELHAEVKKPEEVDPASLPGYDLIGFGSGIYAGRHHVSLLNFVRSMPHMDTTPAFIFSTAAFPELKVFWHHSLANKILRKGLVLAGEFTCKGLSTHALCGVIGGVNRGRPDAGDLARARTFAASLIASMPGERQSTAGESAAPGQ